MFFLGLYFLRFLGRRVKSKFSSPDWKRKSFLVYLLIYLYTMVNLFIYLNLLYHFLEFVFVFIFLFLWSFFYSVKSKCGGTLALRLFEYHFNWGLFISITSVHLKFWSSVLLFVKTRILILSWLLATWCKIWNQNFIFRWFYHCCYLIFCLLVLCFIAGIFWFVSHLVF